MKILSTLFAFLILVNFQINAQSTNVRVYQMMQEKCVSCHGSSSPEAGLDLLGTGATEIQRALSVRNAILNQTPDNDFAAAAGYKLVEPGRVDRSHLFRKINAGLESTIGLNETEEGTPCPKPGSEALTDVEKEMFRQWILYGVKSTGTQVSEEMITDYYTNGGIQAFPDGPPAAPSAEEGFQVKMGPFFIEPGGEVEYFQKWQLEMGVDKEVYRLDSKIGTYSHHFLVYNFEGNGANGIPDGYRLDPNHTNVSLIAAVQEPTDLRLPENTAWKWDNDLLLDLNAHYINYDAANVYKAEAYMNVYTQDDGTAIQEMVTELIVNSDIYIQNDGDLIVETETVNPNYPAGTEIYLWSMTGHTHKYGTSYKTWDRGTGGTEELMYDASCPNGIPGCNSPFYDYQHIPTMYFNEALYPLELTNSTGFRHEARYINDGPSDVWFGPTSDDEMMVMIIMYVEDTTGLNMATTGVFTPQSPVLEDVKVAPNPMTSETFFTLPWNTGAVEFSLTDIAGRQILAFETSESRFSLERGDLFKGVYLYQIVAEDGRAAQGKLIVE
ncbi:MAG: hypothetical protein ACI85O_001231 [Saprospiraceae bacterium]|jgi:hypothetical protein